VDPRTCLEVFGEEKTSWFVAAFSISQILGIPWYWRWHFEYSKTFAVSLTKFSSILVDLVSKYDQPNK
jgi:hypothetical protein